MNFLEKITKLDLPGVKTGHVLDVLAEMPEQSIHMVCTSPPYWGLRRYPTPPIVWDGEPKCKHAWGDALVHPGAGAGNNSAIRGPAGSSGLNVGTKLLATTQEKIPAGQFCRKCHAWRGHLGNEPTPELYIAHLVTIFQALRRVLRDDGVVWLNLGDSYAGSGVNDGTVNPGRSRAAQRGDNPGRRQVWQAESGLKALDLVGIPWSVALALRADGWYLRSDVIWRKLSCMPEPQQGWRWERCKVKGKDNAAHNAALQAESEKVGRTTGGLNVRKDRGTLDIWQPCPGCAKCATTDGYVLRRGSWRPTDSHEYIFMLAKTPNYYCDSEAVKVAAKHEASGNVERKDGEAVGGIIGGGLGRSIPWQADGSGVNLRTVWSLATEPLRESHFAAFPRKLPETCIRAGTSERGCCPTCGAPWARIVERVPMVFRHSAREKVKHDMGLVTALHGTLVSPAESRTIGWRPTCACPKHDPVPCTVLDIFAGSGTTLRVAEDLGRLWLGIDLSDQYAAIVKKRTGQRTLLGLAGRAAVARQRRG